MGSAHPPLEYLITSSNTSLESFELSRLNAVANLRKEIRQIVDAWVQAEIEARIARWVLECRRSDAAASQPEVPHLLESVPAHGNAARVLHAAVEGHSPPLGRQVSPGLKCTSKVGRSSEAAPRGVFLESPLFLGVDQPARQQSLFEELGYVEDLAAATETSPNILQHEFSARALRSLERFVCGRPKLPRRKLHGVAVHRIALLGVRPDKCLLASFAEPLPPGRLVQQASLTESRSHATYVRTGPGRTMIGTSAGLVEEAPARKLQRRGRHSELWPPSAAHAPLRQIQSVRLRRVAAS